MIRVRLDKQSVVNMAGNFSRRLKFSTEKALDNLAVELGDWLTTEQQKGDAGGWPKLGALSKTNEYGKEKERTYPGRPLLTRTGAMMEAYPRYITVNRNKREVAIGFPRGHVGQRAMVHQYGWPANNIPARPFPVDESGYNAFKEIAYRNYADAVREALSG